MKSTMKFKATAISIATMVTFSMISLFWMTPSGSASSSTISFSAGANKFVTTGFISPKDTNVNVAIGLKNNGFPGSNAPKRLTAKLFKPSGLLFDAKEESVDPGQTKRVAFGGKFNEGSSCGFWKVEISNPNDTATNATATITVDFNFVPLPIIKTYPRFSVPQGTMEPRTISVPQSGELTITATWDPRLIPVGFILKKGNSASGPIAVAPPPGNQNDLKLKYRVTQPDIENHGTSWTLEVVASTAGTVRDLTLTSVLTPGCFH